MAPFLNQSTANNMYLCRINGLSIPSVTPSLKYFQLWVHEPSLIKTMIHQYGPSNNRWSVTLLVGPHFVRFPRVVSKVLSFSSTVPIYGPSIQRRTFNGLRKFYSATFFSCFLILPPEYLSYKRTKKYVKPSTIRL